MAATTSYKSGDDSKSDDKSSNKLVFPLGWEPTDPKDIMLKIKDEFIKKVKEVLGHEYPGYTPLDNGIGLNLMGGQYVIGLVKLSKSDVVGGYYASIRAHRPTGLIVEEPWSLTGFLVNSQPILNFVNDGQYGDMFINDKEWKHVEGKENIELLKDAMEQVKTSFIEKSKQDFGFDFKEYYPTNNGIYYFKGDFQNMIGLVKLSKPGTLGGYYASIRASRISVIPISPSWALQGFVIDSRPFSHFVNSGQYGIVARENSLNEIKENVKKVKKDSNVKMGANYFHYGSITWADTGFVQELVDKVKDTIKQKCGINYELKEFKVVSAASQYTGSLIFGVFFGRIYIGINPWTQFSQYINVQVTNTILGNEQTVTVNSAHTFPL